MEKRHLLNLRELITGVPNQLRYVNRYSTTRVMHHENVAEHSYFTAFYALMLCGYVQEKVDEGRVLRAALLHDIDEHYTGDIIRPVKHHTKEIKSVINNIGSSAVFEFFKSLHPMKAGEYHVSWHNSKDDSTEGKLVAFADFLSVLSYLNQEVRGGNHLVMSNVDGLREYIRKFQGKNYYFIGDLVWEAREILEDLIKIKEADRNGTKSDLNITHSKPDTNIVLRLDGVKRQQTRTKARGGRSK